MTKKLTNKQLRQLLDAEPDLRKRASLLEKLESQGLVPEPNHPPNKASIRRSIDNAVIVVRYEALLASKQKDGRKAASRRALVELAGSEDKADSMRNRVADGRKHPEIVAIVRALMNKTPHPPGATDHMLTGMTLAAYARYEEDLHRKLRRHELLMSDDEILKRTDDRLRELGEVEQTSAVQTEVTALIEFRDRLVKRMKKGKASDGE